MKQYILTKLKLFNEIPVKKINYSFKVPESKPLKKIKSIIIHQTGTKNTIQKVINTHIKEKRYSSIGYHLMIGKNGQIYQARNLDQMGAHTFGYNSDSIGIALFGDFNKTEPTRKQIETLNYLIQNIKEKFNIKDVFGYNQAIYNLLKDKMNKQLKGKDLTQIENDIKFYEFLKSVDKKVKAKKNEELESIFNKLKPSPGVHLSKSISDLQRI